MDIRRKINTLEALKSTLNVWEVIAVNRYKKYSSIVGAKLPYFLRLQEVLEHLYSLYSGLRVELLTIREERNIDVLVLTSDRGYLGDFVTRTVRHLEDFMKSKKDKTVNLFVVGRRGFREPLVSLGARLFEDVLTKDINWEGVEEIKNILVGRYRRRQSDACYVLFNRPEVEVGEYGEAEEKRRERTLLEESPFFYTSFEEKLKVKAVKAMERGRYRPVVVRYLPADIRKRYSEDMVVNIEVPEEEFIDKLLELYLNFFMREVFLEHFTSINFARYRTISRILDNIDKKLDFYRRLVNKLRQERITAEIEDIVFAFIATEEKKLRDFIEGGFTLEVDPATPQDVVLSLMDRLEELGIEVISLRKRRLIGGFRLLSTGRSIDLSVVKALSSLEVKVRSGVMKRTGG